MSDLSCKLILVLFKDVYGYAFRLNQMFMIAPILTMHAASNSPIFINPFIHLSTHALFTPQAFCTPIAIQDCFRPVFHKLHPNDILGWIIIYCEWLSCALYNLQQVPTAYTSHPHNCDNQKCLQTFPTLPWCVMGNGSSLKTWFQTQRTQTWIRHCPWLNKQTFGDGSLIWENTITIPGGTNLGLQLFV